MEKRSFSKNLVMHLFLCVLCFALSSSPSLAQIQTTPIQPIQEGWSYRPIYFNEGSRQISTSQALIYYGFPPHEQNLILNVRIVSTNGNRNWLLQNVPVPPSVSRMSYRIRMEMQPFMQQEKHPEQIRLEYFVGPVQYSPEFASQGVVTLQAEPELEDIGGAGIGVHPLFPVMYQPPAFTIPHDADTRRRIVQSMQALDELLRDSLNVSLPPFNASRVDSLLRNSRPLDIVTFSGIVSAAMPFNVSMDFMLLILLPIESVFRGDDVPNIDLDSSKDPTDLNACAPAATANSLAWLDEQHEEIDLPGDMRETMNELKKLMKHLKESGTEWDSMVKGKLDFINKNNLPINVKYQAHAGAPEELKSNDPQNTETAKNKSRPNPDKPGKYYHPDFEWLMQELEDGEDVELIWGHYCDTVVQDTTWVEVNVPIVGKKKMIKEIKPRAKKTRRSGHVVNVTGAATIGPFKYITYKHDAQQGKAGGTSGIDDDEDATDVSQWVTDERGYANFANRNYKDANDGVDCTVYVEAVISESYAPPPTEEKDTPTDEGPEDKSSQDDDPEEAFAGPWDHIDFSSAEMKVLSVPPVITGNNIPIIPILTGVVGGGVLIYVLAKDEKEEDCSFAASLTVTPTTCNQDNGIVLINTEVNATFTWSNGATTRDLLNVSAGTYSVTISRTGTSCTRVLQAQVTNVDLPIDISFTTQSAACGQADGAAMANVAQIGTYFYSWSDGTTMQFLGSVTAGTYTLTVTSIDGCSATAQVTIDELPPSFSLTTTSTPSNCGGADGTATVTPDSPDTYTYQWSNGQTTQKATNLIAGSYTVTVTLQGTSCSKTAEVTVSDVPTDLTLTTTSTPANCGVADGTANVSADPPGVYTYLWSNGQTTPQATNLTSGIYTVTVTLQGTTCSNSSEVTVGDLPPAFTLTITTTPANCGTADGTATVNADPPALYSYSWSGGQNTSTVTNLTAGLHTVTVTLTGTACSKTIEVTIAELPPSLILTFSATPAGCGQSDGTATVTVDPAGEYTYQWSNGQTTQQANTLPAGEYMVTVTIPGTSCSVASNVVVPQITPSFTASITTNPAHCGVPDGVATVLVDPPGPYTYLWSNQQTSSILQNVLAGPYSVTVTDENACTASFNTDISALPADYFSVISTAPANCTGGGEIVIEMFTPGAGPLIVEIILMGGISTVSLPPGQHSLSSLLNILPGVYTLNVFDESIGPICSESQDVTIQDQTPVMDPNDDQYTTTLEMPVEGNVLTNDAGLNLMLIVVSNVVGGTVTFTPDGEFVFIPSPGFVGDASFMYTVQDACGNTGTAIVIITVEQVECQFTIQSFETPAHCGLEDGSIFVEVNEPGTYTYLWSNGENGNELVDVPAGVYGLTITDVSLGCFLEFELEITEYPATYVENIEVIQPSCTDPGDVIFDLIPPLPQDVFTMVVTHPGGTHEFQLEPGTISLRDYVPIIPGDFDIEIFIGDPGAGCVDGFSVTFNAPAQLVIELEAVLPPSEPTAMDGIAIITVTSPGVLPYTVFVNGIPTMTANSNTFQITGLGASEYQVQIQDATGCFSNVLLVIVPFPGIVFYLESGLTNIPVDFAPVEKIGNEESTLLANKISLRLHYSFLALPQQTSVSFLPLMRTDVGEVSWWQVKHQQVIWNWSPSTFGLDLKGGFGYQEIKVDHINVSSPFIALDMNASMCIGKKLMLKADVGIYGWKNIETPTCGISISIPISPVYYVVDRR